MCWRNFNCTHTKHGINKLSSQRKKHDLLNIKLQVSLDVFKFWNLNMTAINVYEGNIPWCIRGSDKEVYDDSITHVEAVLHGPEK